MSAFGSIRRRGNRRVAALGALLVCCTATSVFAQVRRPSRPTTRLPGATTPPPPAPTLTAFVLSVDSISGGPGTYQPNGKVTLSAPAPAGGLQISLSSDNPAVTVPALIAVPPSATEKTFTFTTAVVSAPTVARIAAQSGSVTVTDSVKLLLRVISVTPEPTPPGDGTRAAWRVTLSGPAPAGGITPSAHIQSSGYGGGGAPCAPIPVFTQPFIPSGATSGVVEIRVDQSLYTSWPWSVFYGYHAAPTLQFFARTPVLTRVDLPATLTGGSTGYGTVQLSGSAPGPSCAQVDAATYNRLFTFYFSSNSAVVQVPASARVDPSQSTRPFSITASAVSSQQTATITVSQRTISGQLTAVKQVAITVTP